MARDVDKGPDAFRTISEVADDLDLPQHVLRFWEGRFPQIKPLKRGGGRRYYRPDDVDLLKGIRHLLYGEGYTIRGVQRILKEQGVRFVMTVWQEGAPPPPPGRAGDFADDPGDPRHGGHHDPRHAALDDDFGFDDGFATEPATAPAGPDEPPFGPAYGDEPGAEAGPSVASIAQRFAPRLGEPQRAAPRALHVERHPDDEPTVARPPQPRSERMHGERLPAGVAPDDDEPADEGRSALGAFIDRLRPGHAGRAEAEPATPPRLSRDDVRHLQATLFELLECKRLLDQAR